MHMHTPTPTPSHAQARKERAGGARMPAHPLRGHRDELWGIANRGDFDLRVHQESSGHRLTFRDGPAADAEEVGSTSKYLGLHGAG